MASRRSAREGEGPGREVACCSLLAGEPVVNRANEALGTLEHVTVELPAGRIAYGVLSRGGVMGLGAKLFAVPWDALVRDAARRCFVLDVPVEQLRRAPGFDRDHWPDVADPAFLRAVPQLPPQPARERSGSLQ